jgi:hypothetical protein
MHCVFFLVVFCFELAFCQRLCCCLFSPCIIPCLGLLLFALVLHHFLPCIVLLIVACGFSPYIVATYDGASSFALCCYCLFWFIAFALCCHCLMWSISLHCCYLLWFLTLCYYSLYFVSLNLRCCYLLWCVVLTICYSIHYDSSFFAWHCCFIIPHLFQVFTSLSFGLPLLAMVHRSLPSIVCLLKWCTPPLLPCAGFGAWSWRCHIKKIRLNYYFLIP